MLMKHCAPNHLVVDKDGALFKTRVILSLKLLLILLYQLIKFLKLLAVIVFEIS